jgi:hypothetical protein
MLHTHGGPLGHIYPGSAFICNSHGGALGHFYLPSAALRRGFVKIL